MREPEELSDDQIAELRADLVELTGSLTAALAMGAESSKTVALDQTAVGRVSRMAAMQVQEMAKANLRSTRIRLEMVEHALRLAEDGDYGYCRRCEEPVGFRRLKARPETPFCLACQGALEAR